MMNGMNRMLATSLLVMGMAMAAGCGKKEATVIRAFDRQHMKMIVLSGEKTKIRNFYDPEFVVIGGGLSGIASALAICYSGKTAMIIEETDRITGCFGGPGPFVFPESRLAETTGSSKMYREFRTKIQEWYRTHSQIPPSTPPSFSSLCGPGFSGFCFETDASHDVIADMLREKVESGSLTILTRHKVMSAKFFNKKLASLLTVDLDKMVVDQVTGFMFLDATEHGDLFPIVNIRSISGRESRADTREPHAPEQADSLFALETAVCTDGQSRNANEDCYTLPVQTGVRPGAADPYTFSIMKEPRRIIGLERVTEQDIAAESNPGPRARFRKDSIGIGFAPIVLDGPEGGMSVIETKPFQIPLGVLLPEDSFNVIATGRNISVTHIASRAFCTPEIEWTTGEAAGYLASYCVGLRISTHDIVNDAVHLRDFQELLVKQYGIPVYWYDDVRPGDDDFAEAQLKPFTDPVFHDSAVTLHYRK